MSFIHVRCLSAGVLLILCGPVGAQEPRIEQARQLQGLAKPRPEATAIAVTPSERATWDDAESFGVQQMLREKESPLTVRTFAEVAGFVTDNVALARREALTDSFLVATFGFEMRHALPRGFQAEVGVTLATFRYNEFSQLDFNSLDVGAGVSVHAEQLGGLDFFARYNFNALYTTETHDNFFQNHTITLGGQKTVVLGQAHSVFAGLSGLLGFADPTASGRTELTAYAGYHLAATRCLEADVLYRYGYYFYARGGREDQNHTLSVGLRYRVTNWCSVSATSYYVWDRSNQNVFNYDAGTAGGAITFSLQF